MEGVGSTFGRLGVHFGAMWIGDALNGHAQADFVWVGPRPLTSIESRSNN